MDYKTSGSLLARGARWGDIEDYDVDEILLDLEKRRDEIKTAKANRCMVRAAKAEARAKREAEAPRAAPRAAAPAPPRAPARAPPRAPPRARRVCIGCNKFTIHSNPPSHFTEEDRNYCCAYCNVTGGKGHGGSCERKR